MTTDPCARLAAAIEFILGRDSGAVRLPLAEASKQTVDRINEILTNLNLSKLGNAVHA